MNIFIVNIAYNCIGATKRLYDSLSSKHDIYLHLFLHTHRFPEKTEECIKVSKNSNVTFENYGINRGLSKSWNEGIIKGYEDGADIVMLVNEDIVFSENDLDRIVISAENNRDKAIVSAYGNQDNKPDRKHHSLGFACAVINPIAIEKVGYFDENFFPLFCENWDYSRRLKILGLKEGFCKACNVAHIGAASVIDDIELKKQNNVVRELSKRYYAKKWGGGYQHEKYKIPFNNPAFSLKIEKIHRRYPYPNHNRNDQYRFKI